MTIRIFDAPTHGKRTVAGEIRLEAGPLKLRNLIRGRLQQEVERYNQALPETFQGLVQPEESEQILNGFRMKTKRPLDWEVQFPAMHARVSRRTAFWCSSMECR
ncbi:MAG: hypothetical protein WCA38_05910 [Candidatus Acidiferrales bacterium]